MDASYIYVQAKDGSPLMPTKRERHVQKLLKRGKAQVVEHVPFVIRLKYDSPKHVQPLYGGTDPGRTNIGNAVMTKNGTVVYKDHVTTRNREIAKLMDRRRQHRQASRRGERLARKRLAKRLGTTMKGVLNRKLPGYGEGAVLVKNIINTEARFNNRKRPLRWTTPSVRQLVLTHVNMVRRIRKILPVDTWALEINKFAFMQLDDGSVVGTDFQNGRLRGYRNVKDYIWHMQRGKCLCCGQEIRHYHHIRPRRKGGSDVWYNIVGLCEGCHAKVHRKELSLEAAGIKKRYAGTSVLNQAIPRIAEALEKEVGAFHTCTGGDTHDIRERYSVSKTHENDAVCIAANGLHLSCINDRIGTFEVQQFRRHDRSGIKSQRERTYFRVISENGRTKRTAVARNRKPRFEQKGHSLADAGLSRQDISRLEVKKSVRYYNHAGRIMPGAEFCHDGNRYIMSGQLSDGAYLRAVGQGGLNFRRKGCRIIQKNRGLVYLEENQAKAVSHD